MRIESYSPSVEVYVAAIGKGGVAEYYDVSCDVTSCRVTRAENGISTFSVKLQNKNGKYNNRFLPMDVVTIYATKRGKRQQLLTGYINSVTRFTLYPQDFEISGSCSLYRLQKLYWDSGLLSSVQLLTEQREMSFDANWTNYTSLIYKLVCIIGGMPSNILVGDVPPDVIGWIRGLYAANQTAYDDIKGRVNAFYDMLTTTTTGLLGASSTTGSVFMGGGKASAAVIEKAVQWALQIAADERVGYDWYHGRGEGILEGKQTDLDCSSLVYWSLVASGGWTEDQLGGYPFATGGMTSVLTRNGFAKVAWDKNPSSLQRGDILWQETPWGHTEIYVGDGKAVGAHIGETGNVEGNKYGDQTGDEVSVADVGTTFSHYFRYTGGA